MTTALPAATDFTGAAITEAQFKTAMTSMRTHLADLLGVTGTPIVALQTLGALASAWVSKTAAYNVVAADRGKVIGCSGTFTLSLTAAATLGADFSFAVLNYGTGTITIDPNSTEQIDAATTITLAPKESCLVICTSGTAFRTIGREIDLNSLTEDTAPDSAADFLLSYDTSAGLLKKVKPENLSTESMTLLGTLTTTSGATQTLSGLTLTDYKMLVCSVEGVSLNGLGILYLNSLPISNAMVDPANKLDGLVWIELLTGIATATIAETDVAGAVRCVDTAYSTASTSIVFGSNGYGFDSGQIRVWGAK